MKISALQLILLYMILTVIGLILSQVSGDLFTAVLPVATGEQLFSVLVGTVIAIVLIFSFIIRRNKELEFKELQTTLKSLYQTQPERAITYGLLVAILSIVLLTAISHWNSNTTIPTVRELGTIIMLSIVFFPFLFIKEIYFRLIQNQLTFKGNLHEYFTMTGIAILMDTALLVPVMIIMWGKFLALAITAFIAIIILQHIPTTWVFMFSGRSQRNILGSSVFLTIFFAWIIINFFPYI